MLRPYRLCRNLLLSLCLALASGYKDPLYFSRQFRKRTGQAPRAYRSGL